VGINRRTGRRWRHGRSILSSSGRRLHYPPVITTGAGRREISLRYLSEDERVQIADLRRAGAGVRAIAERLGRSPSTVGRELRRNRDPVGGRYQPFTAHKLAAQRRARPRAGKIARDEALRQFVQDHLEKRWSPEQISQALRGQFPGDPARHVVHETIYQALYRPEMGGLSRELPARALRTRRRRRGPHRRSGERRPNGITAMMMIGQRPAEAVSREEPGHWEGDLITGTYNRSAIGTLVDRASRFTALQPDGADGARPSRAPGTGPGRMAAGQQVPVPAQYRVRHQQPEPAPAHPAAASAARRPGTLGGQEGAVAGSHPAAAAGP